MTKHDVDLCAHSVARDNGRILNFIVIVHLKDGKLRLTSHNNLMVDPHVLSEDRGDFAEEVRKLLEIYDPMELASTG